MHLYYVYSAYSNHTLFGMCLYIHYTHTRTHTLQTNSRYDGQIAVFGRTLQQQLFNTNTFLVGAGAIGCEMLKNWALMGISTASDVITASDVRGGVPGGSDVRGSAPGDVRGVSEQGDVRGRGGFTHVTDMDQIERSNLSRQFLFRNTDIGKLKSSTAVYAVQQMSPQFKACVYESRVGGESVSYQTHIYIYTIVAFDIILNIHILIHIYPI